MPPKDSKRFPIKDKEHGVITQEDMRELALIAAGFDADEIGRFMRLSANKLIEKLDAKTSKVVTHEGEVTEILEFEDNNSQIRAAKELKDLGLDIAGLRKKGESSGKNPPQVTIDLSGWNVSPPTPRSNDTTSSAQTD